MISLVMKTRRAEFTVYTFQMMLMNSQDCQPCGNFEILRIDKKCQEIRPIDILWKGIILKLDMSVAF